MTKSVSSLELIDLALPAVQLLVRDEVALRIGLGQEIAGTAYREHDDRNRTNAELVARRDALLARIDAISHRDAIAENAGENRLDGLTKHKSVA